MDEHGEKLPSAKNLRGFNTMLLQLMGGNTFLSQIDRPRVKALRLKLERRMVHYVDGDRPLSEAQINHHIKHLRAVMRMAMLDWGANASPHLIRWSGTEGLMLTVPDYQRRIIEDEAEEQEIRDTLAADTRPLFDFSVETGVRAMNAMTLEKPQVDWKKREILFRVKSRKRDRRMGVSGKMLRVAITEPIEAILRAVWDDHPTRVFSYVARSHRTEIDKVTGERIVRRKGRRYPFTPSILRDRWNEVRKKLGLKGLKWHGLRAKFITDMLRAKERIEVVRDVVGHADIRTTESYAVVFENDKREAMERAAKRRQRADKQRYVAKGLAQNRHSAPKKVREVPVPQRKLRAV
jgi:integrase